MRLVAQFEVFGRCVPWSMPEVGVRGGRPRFCRKDPALIAWQARIVDAARTAMDAAPVELGPVMLDIEFYRETPLGKQHGDWWDVRVEHAPSKGKHTKRGQMSPDLTNLLKGTEDAIEEVVIGNDAQTCRIVAGRLYGPQDGVRVTAYALEPGDRPASA
jgi:Holliday junction resolvase RusA-like endonuclease